MSDSVHYPLQKLRSLFDRFSSKHILVIGDLILDQYIWGDVGRISPEAPVPVVSVTQREFRLGGAGNTAANLASMQCQVSIAGVTGRDSKGERIRHLLDEIGVRAMILEDSSRRSTQKSRVIARHQQLLRIDEEDHQWIGTSVQEQLLERIRGIADSVDGVILSDYAKGLLAAPLIKNILQVFTDKPVIIDPKGYNYQKYSGATAVKPNFVEFSHAVKHPEISKDEIEKQARRLVEKLALQGLVVTLGENGVFVLDDHGNYHTIPTRAKEVFDVSGAGDTFTAAFTAGLVISKDWFLAAQAGNLASGIVVAKVGTATVTAAEILADLDSDKS